MQAKGRGPKLIRAYVTWIEVIILNIIFHSVSHDTFLN